MTYEEAARILLDAHISEVTADQLYDCGRYISCRAGEEDGTLDDGFSARELRAIAEWMDHPSEVAAAYARLKASKE